MSVALIIHWSKQPHIKVAVTDGASSARLLNNNISSLSVCTSRVDKSKCSTTGATLPNLDDCQEAVPSSYHGIYKWIGSFIPSKLNWTSKPSLSSSFARNVLILWWSIVCIIPVKSVRFGRIFLTSSSACQVMCRKKKRKEKKKVLRLREI